MLSDKLFRFQTERTCPQQNFLMRTSKVMNRNLIFFKIPVFLLELGVALLGKREVEQRIFGSLQVNIEKTIRLLNWTSPLTLEQGIKKAVEGFTN
jgi:hypothetical protein